MKSWTVERTYLSALEALDAGAAGSAGKTVETVQADHCFVNADGTLVFTRADGPTPIEQTVIRAFTPRRWVEVQLAGEMPPPAPDPALCPKP